MESEVGSLTLKGFGRECVDRWWTVTLLILSSYRPIKSLLFELVREIEN